MSTTLTVFNSGYPQAMWTRTGNVSRKTEVPLTAKDFTVTPHDELSTAPTFKIEKSIPEAAFAIPGDVVAITLDDKTTVAGILISAKQHSRGIAVTIKSDDKIVHYTLAQSISTQAGNPGFSMLSLLSPTVGLGTGMINARVPDLSISASHVVNLHTPQDLIHTTFSLRSPVMLDLNELFYAEPAPVQARVQSEPAYRSASMMAESPAPYSASEGKNVLARVFRTKTPVRIESDVPYSTGTSVPTSHSLAMVGEFSADCNTPVDWTSLPVTAYLLNSDPPTGLVSGSVNVISAERPEMVLTGSYSAWDAKRNAMVALTGTSLVTSETRRSSQLTTDTRLWQTTYTQDFKFANQVGFDLRVVVRFVTPLGSRLVDAKGVDRVKVIKDTPAGIPAHEQVNDSWYTEFTLSKQSTEMSIVFTVKNC